MTSRPTRPRRPFLLGAHFSIAQGLDQALYAARDLACTSLQIFTKNASTWKERDLTPAEIERFDRARKATGIAAIIAHAAYLINLAATDARKHQRSLKALRQELFRSGQLGLPYVVLHPGAHMGSGEAAGLMRIADSLNQIFDRLPELPTRLLLETTAGQGSSLGHTFEQLASIRARLHAPERVGFCLDTGHVFAAGYDLRSEAAYTRTIDTFAAAAGLENLLAIHLNDSKKELGTRVDRHEHIGQGCIGLKAFELFINDPRWDPIPKIIETPKQHCGQDYDPVNLNILRNLVRRPRAAKVIVPPGGGKD